MSIFYSREASETPFRFRYQWVSSALRSYDDEDNVDVSPSVATTVKRLPSTPPPISWTTSTTQQPDAPRKSLSAKYIEEKSKISSPAREEKPYENPFIMDHSQSTDQIVATQHSSEDGHIQTKTLYPDFSKSSELAGERMARPLTLKNMETSSSESEDEEHQPVDLSPLPPDLDTVIIAGDGNPVRHSLLSLVMEEDIPALMEAMSERFTCEFEDLDESRPSTSSILHPPETRKEPAEVGLTHDEDDFHVDGVTSRFDYPPAHNDSNTMCV
ncbi:unnamed protein product [Strongylus vulgaris]|uniref:Uncharacterized protein n=1 Tax=Strongylus vulgaris TaxID=40348 RepID=A0A3P7INW8_STRVU|nr:unnamed protein product [Strongylus vulgaris]